MGKEEKASTRTTGFTSLEHIVAVLLQGERVFNHLCCDSIIKSQLCEAVNEKGINGDLLVNNKGFFVIHELWNVGLEFVGVFKDEVLLLGILPFFEVRNLNLLDVRPQREVLSTIIDVTVVPGFEVLVLDCV